MKYFAIFITALSLMGAGCLALPQRQSNQNATTTQALPKGALIIYVEDGCSHCAYVESKIKNGLVDKKISITFKEVSNNLDNAREMISKAQICNILETNLGVPFLWDGQTCYVGQDKILDYIALRMKEFNK